MGATDLAGLGGFPLTVADQVLCPDDFGPLSTEFFLDVFEVVVAEGEYIDLAIDGGAVLTPDCADMSLELGLWATIDDPLATDNTGDGSCPAFTLGPDAGTWYVIVRSDDVYFGPQDYTLLVDVGLAVCGDSTLQGLEECDDGNAEGGDGCSAGCVIEDLACPVTSDVSTSLGGAAVTGTTAGGQDLHAPSCLGGTGSPDVAYEFTVAGGASVIVSTVSAATAFDTVLYVREECLDPSSEIACNDDFGGSASQVSFDALDGVTYYIIVDGYAGADGAFELTLSSPVCGDSSIEGTEECDDGNLVDGDGCEADCTVTRPCSYTVNDALGALASGSTTTLAIDLVTATDDLPDLSCSVMGGNDWLVSFEVTTAGAHVIDYDNTGGDVQYGLFAGDGSCTPVFECVDPFPATLGTFTETLAVGTYYLALDAYGPGGEGPVDLTITAP